MTPYCEFEGVTIYHGDYRSWTPAIAPESVALVLTDPPYNISDRNGRDNTTVGVLKRSDGSARKVWKDFGQWDRGFDAGEFCQTVAPLIGPRGSLIAFTSEFLIAQYLASPLNHRSLIFWRKTNPTPAFRQLYVRSVEMAVWQVKGQPWTFNAGGYTPQDFEGPSVTGGDAERVHPTQKPLWLMAKLVAIHSERGDTVLDPFMGSGTTLVAAKRNGCAAIGIEIEERYCEIAAKRLSQEMLPFGVAQ